jgi:hypothetical protein
MAATATTRITAANLNWIAVTWNQGLLIAAEASDGVFVNVSQNLYHDDNNAGTPDVPGPPASGDPGILVPYGDILDLSRVLKSGDFVYVRAVAKPGVIATVIA